MKTFTRIVIIVLGLTSLNCVSLNTAKEITSREIDHDITASINCEKSGTKISIIPFCYKYIPSQPYIDQIGDIPLINIRRIPLDNLGNAFEEYLKL